MMAKIVQGSCFRGAINYVLDREKAEHLASKGVRTSDKNAMIHSFERQAKLNPIAKPVAHISLDFSAQDKDKLTSKMMVEIALEYMKKMGYGNTQVLMVRHFDREHPHLHLILNRVDFDGKRISDRNEKLRNMTVCKELTAKHGLYLSSGKENVKRHRLREPDATKYQIYDSLVKNVPLSKSWAELEKRLKAEGIEVGFKTKGSTSQIEGVRFTANDLSFNGSKVDRQFSYSKIDWQLKQNARQHEFAQRQTFEPAQHHSHNTETGIGSLLSILPDMNDSVPEHEETLAEAEARRRKKMKKGRRM